MYVRDRSSRILDPFAGVGTTLDVAASKRLKANGLDSNPLACLIAESRLRGIPPARNISEAVDEISRRLSALRPMKNSEQDELRGFWENERYSYSRKWFRQDTLNSLLRLLFAITDVNDPQVQRLLYVLTAQTVRDVASVDPRCTHHLVTKRKPFVNPVPLLKERVSQGFGPIRTSRVLEDQVSINQASFLELTDDNHKFDFALVHPPYLGVIHYHLIHRLATDLLDFVKQVRSPNSLRSLDFDYDKIKSMDVSTDNTDLYIHFVKRLAGVMEKAITLGGRSVVIIGDQRYKQHIRHPFTYFIQEFENHGFLLEDTFVWVLQNMGGLHVLRRGNFIDHNYVLVFHKTR